MSCSNEVASIDLHVPQITNGIIWLIEVFRSRVKKGKGPHNGPFLNKRPQNGVESARNSYFWIAEKAESSQCGFFGSVAAYDEAFATSGSP